MSTSLNGPETWRLGNSGDVRYKVYALAGDDVRELVTQASPDEARAVANAITFDSLGIYGRVLVQDHVTGQVVACFEQGKPIDPATVEAQ
jgi:hypothetical protein